jgi:adenine-specific DNA-methyltransferase
MSDYCRNNAKHKFSELVKDIKTECLVVSCNNAYDSKSNSSRNKITLEEVERILMKRGSAKNLKKDYRYFNAGSTDF